MSKSKESISIDDAKVTITDGGKSFTVSTDTFANLKPTKEKANDKR